MPLTKNELHIVTITGYTSEGEGVARVDGQVVFVKGAIAGEVLKIRILKAGKTVAWARIEAILSPMPHRAVPACPAYGPCGGCDFLHMDYTEELRLKENRVADAMARVGNLDAPVAPIIAAKEQSHYRNKAIFAVGDGPVTGFYRRRSHAVVPVEKCLIQTDAANRAASALREWMSANDVLAYNEAAHDGLIRHLFVREAHSTGEIAICVVAAKAALPHQDALIETFRRHCPEVAGIVLCVNPESGNVALQGDVHTLWGEAYLADTICGLTFRLSPRSFFQINPPQAERLYAKTLEYANLTGTEIVLDLYCGTGAITLVMAQHARHAIGAEIVDMAVRDARENAKANSIANAEFLLADAAVAADGLKRRGLAPDVVVVDPPRKGLAPAVIGHIADMAPRRIVYVSCDPATLARDLKLLAERGYRTQEVTPVDMFPRCAHVECVALLQREDS